MLAVAGFEGRRLCTAVSIFDGCFLQDASIDVSCHVSWQAPVPVIRTGGELGRLWGHLLVAELSSIVVNFGRDMDADTGCQ
jgi:hypothetical protein